jgi:uncharacterized protein YdaU (DUF1376 family)
MHYYQFNVADYRKDTVHLSITEHYIYRQLIDWYYLDERPIPKKTQSVMRRLQLDTDGLSDLENVLNDFFELTDDGYIHHKIESEIEKFHRKAKTAKVNGKLGGRPKGAKGKPKKTQQVNLANPEETGSKPNQEPITINQEPKKRGFTPPSVSEVGQYISEKQYSVDAQNFVDFYTAKGWMVGSGKMKDWQAAVRTWQNREKKDNHAQPQGKYIN